MKQTKLDTFIDNESESQKSVSTIIPDVINTFIKIPIQKPKVKYTVAHTQSTYRV